MPRHKPQFLDEDHPETCSVDLRLEILSRLPFFAGLDAPAIAEINRSFRDVGFAPGENIYAEGDPAERLYVVATGKVKLLRSTLAGQDVLYGILAPGEFFGGLAILGDAAYPDTAQAVTDCCILAASSSAFQDILTRHPTVTIKVLEAVGARLRKAEETVKHLSVYTAEQRIAATLLRLAEKLGKPAGTLLLIQAPLSRQDLASMTGTTVETASRVLSQFRRDGLVQSGRGWVALADRQRLAQLAEGV